jgi:hypothetical protein
MPESERTMSPVDKAPSARTGVRTRADVLLISAEYFDATTAYKEAGERAISALTSMLSLSLEKVEAAEIASFTERVNSVFGVLSRPPQTKESVLADIQRASPAAYADVNIPIESAAFTSLAFQCVFSKPLGEFGVFAAGALAIFYGLFDAITDPCAGFDGTPHPEYKGVLPRCTADLSVLPRYC